MCGITGFTIHTDPFRTACQITRMTSQLVHRGPDSQGIFTDDFVALGARRLSIMDISNGNQPFYNEARDIVVVMNGEIYNDTELRNLLIDRGHILTSTCDTELIPHLYEEFGLDCIGMLDGMFAFALWDRKRTTLIIAGDPVGIKPLYYSVLENGHLVFASELKALRTAAVEAFAIDPVSMTEYLRFKAIPAPHTPYQNIYKLLPGEVILWSNGELERMFVEVDRSDKKDNLEQLLHESVRTTMRSDVPVGSVVSGGLDSSYVLSSMSRESTNSVQSYAVGYPGQLHDDETKYAAQITEEVGGKFTRVSIAPEEIPDLLPRVIWHLDEPNQDPITIPFYALMRTIHEQHTVVLTGDGADELFGGYARFRHLAGSQDPQGKEEYLRELQVFSWEDLERFLLPERREQMLHERQSTQELSSISSLRDVMKWERTYRLPAYHLQRVDKISMAWGVEARVPFLRPALVQAAAALTEQELVRNDVEKYALRRAVEPVLPQWLMDRKKKPFTFPISEWMRNELREWMYETLLNPQARIRDWLCLDQVSVLLQEHVERVSDHSHKIWGLLVLETFLQQQDR